VDQGAPRRCEGEVGEPDSRSARRLQGADEGLCGRAEEHDGAGEGGQDRQEDRRRAAQGVARGAQAGEVMVMRCAAVTLVAAALFAHTANAQSILRSRVAVTTTARGYRVGDSSVTERVANVRYELFGARTRLRLDGSALAYSAGGVSINGTLPIGGRLDFELRPGDTLAVYA